MVAYTRRTGRAGTEACLFCLLLAAPVFAEPGSSGLQNEPAAFNVLGINPSAYAGLVVGTAAAPNCPWAQALGVLYAGADRDVRIWSLEGIFSSRIGRGLVGTATLVPLPAAAGMPCLTALAVCRAGDELDCWTLVNTDEVRPIAPSLLERIMDGKPISVGTPEIDAYNEFLVLASQTADKAFRAAARPDVRYAHLFNQPSRHRGQVVQFTGRLKRLLRFDPPEEVVVQGVRDLYEGWMFDPELLGANPICLLFTELPRGLAIGEKMDRKVSFAGYFFKKYRYKALDSHGNLRRDAPLLIGRTLTLLDSAPAGSAGTSAETNDWAHDLLPGFLALVTATIVAVIGLTVWFRRADSRVYKRLAAARPNDKFVPPPADEISSGEVG